MRKLALLFALGACHATASRPPPESITTSPVTTTPVVEAVAPVVPVTPVAAPAPAPTFGLLFVRRCTGYLRSGAASPSATRVLACDQVYDDDGHFRATPREPVAALFDDGAALVFAQRSLARMTADGSLGARANAPTVDSQNDLVALGREARTALWLRTRTGDLVELDTTSMRTLRRVPVTGAAKAIAYAHDGTPMVVRGADDEAPTLARWEGSSLVEIALPAHTREVSLADLGTVALAITDRTHVTALSLPDGATRRAHTLDVGDDATIPSPDAPLVSPSPDGRSVVVCDARGLSLQRLDGDATTVVVHDRCLGPPRFSADGRTIVTGAFGVSLLREGAPARTRTPHDAVTFELASVPEGFVPWTRVDDRGQDVLTPQGSSPENESHMVPEGFVRAWHHRTAGANLWVTHHDDEVLRLDRPLDAWALAALDVFDSTRVLTREVRAWRGPDGARAVEARWRQDGCDPADVIVRVQEHAGGVTVARMEVWSSRAHRERWWSAMVTPVLGARPADATTLQTPRAVTR